MCAHYGFYTSGHYTSFSAIQWHSAFLFRKEVGDNLLIPALLIIYNTFGSYFIHGIALPVSILSPLCGIFYSMRNFNK